MTDHFGQVVLVTGVAGDIGHGIVAGFIAAGARVVCTDIRSTMLGARWTELEASERVEFVEADLSQADEVDSLARGVLERWGGVDVLVNNAAIQHDGDVEGCPPAEFDYAYAVNLRAPYMLCHLLVPAMRARGGGAIVNVGSVHATAPGPSRLAYSTMKAGLLGMTRSLAVDLGKHGIRVNAVSPSATDTTQLRQAWDLRSTSLGAGDLRSHASRQHPLGRIADVSDVVGAVLFLAAAPFVSGIELRVDGGLLSSLRLLPIGTPE